MAAAERWVGKSLERFEDAALLTGRARFMDDLEPAAGVCHAAILRSQHGCADIRSIDVAAALALPGVIGVLTPDDVAAMSNPIGNMVSRKLRYYPCAVDRARYFGVALRLKQTENVGAYLGPPDPASLYRMHSTLSGPYRVRHIAVENKVVVTNQVPSGLNRTPGILASATQFLNEHANASERDICDMLSGHICRCTGYTGIIEAISATAQNRKSRDQKKTSPEKDND
jgi:CO/xanthine dehydrogenase Mo-binding subunit